MALSLDTGAQIVIDRWCRVFPGENVLILSDEGHVEEGMALWRAADRLGASVELLTIQSSRSHPGAFFHSIREFVLRNDLVIGATNFSLITNCVTQEVLAQGGRFLSLPLATNNGSPLLSFDFLDMDPEEAARTGRGMLSALERAERVHITTALGTDLTFGKRGRRPGLFNGLAGEPGKVGSSSFEIYMGVEETVTDGVAVLDGSLGYLGCPAERIRLTFRAGRLAEIEANASGERLRHYMDSFGDPGIYVAGELGIGLNKKSRCVGNCYIEDESAFTTFHIGMGRNLALGGVHDAAGHFDLVFHRPTIYADGVPVMEDGRPAV